MESVDYSEQITRIKKKLSKAQKVDSGLKVFGASTHKYAVGTGMPRRELVAFQKAHGIALPPDFEAFLLAFGYPNQTVMKSIAGPFYGVFNLGFDLAMIPDGSQSFLSKTSVIYPQMPPSEWKKLVNGMPEEDDAYDAYERHLMSGIYTLGEQGCSSYHGLLLTGSNRGKVINFDIEYYADGPPRFAYENNFLDWYERWLDEIISGVLLKNKGYWFGYVMRGDEKELIEIIFNAKNKEEKIMGLNGFSIIDLVQSPTLKALEQVVKTEADEVKHLALLMLTKFNSEVSRPYLKQMIAGDDAAFKAACNSIWKVAKPDAHMFEKDISIRLETVDDSETYRAAMFVLDEIDGDFASIITQGTTHSNADIRRLAFYRLGKQKFHSSLVPYFIAGLHDDEHRVVHAALQALSGSKDLRFLEPYYHIAKSYWQDDSYVLVNLKHRLDEIGFHSVPYFEKCYEAGEAQAAYKKYTSGKGFLNHLRRAFSK